MAHDENRNRIQLHLVLPYKFDPIEHHEIRSYLDRGYLIEQLQRVTDREAIVTLAIDAAPTGGSS